VLFHLKGGEIFSLVFGQAWKDGGEYLSLIILFQVLDIFIYPFFHLLNLWRKYSSVLFIEISRFICVYGIIPVCIYFYQWNFPFYIFMHLISMFVFSGLMIICILYYSSKSAPEISHFDDFKV
jgi:O-antigen/teichoic acid export membrane protein